MGEKNQTDSLLCGIDLGGTKVAVALVRNDGVIHAKRLIRNHRGRAPQDVVDLIATHVRQLADESGLDVAYLNGIGVGSSGHVDYQNGVVITNSNLTGFQGFPLGERLEHALGVPIYLDNDANAQAYAEFRFGAGRGFPNMAFITVSTGVGAGLIIDGHVYRGVTGTAGEFGHTIIEPSSTIRCGCGRLGCLMAYTSGLTLPQVVRTMLADHDKSHPVTSSIDFASLADEEITGELIGNGFTAGDAFCRNVVEQNADYIAIGLNNLYQIVNPGHFVIGGGLTAWGPAYIDRIRTQFRGLVETMATEIPEIRPAHLGGDAAVIGAAALPMEYA